MRHLGGGDQQGAASSGQPDAEVAARVVSQIRSAGAKGVPNARLGRMEVAPRPILDAALASLVSERLIVRRPELRLNSKNHMTLQVVWYPREAAPARHSELAEEIFALLTRSGSRGLTKGELDAALDYSDREVRSALGELLDKGAVSRRRALRKAPDGVSRSFQVWRIPSTDGVEKVVGSRAGRRREYHVYVIRLSEDAHSKVLDSTPPDLRSLVDSARPCLYVGYTSETPERRFAKHLKGGRTSAAIVRDFGEGLAPSLFASRNPIASEDDALAAEAKLAADLRAQGYAVYGSHGERLRL